MRSPQSRGLPEAGRSRDVSMPLDISAMSTLLRVLVAVTALMFLVMLAFLAAAARLRRANTGRPNAGTTSRRIGVRPSKP
jgi:hypothetical protein